ncbi:sensor domain-containing diguanylate cyclase [Paraburkholderia bannensis]|uniref:sensor domain-containing diguanylate cyclase n=1 Tax=Paraburkholderia bannensis TaxID=765414 RepID=UPI002AB6FE8E|nr:diguanylate cyclase [Paraburkholderia bannensis]
MSLLIGSDRPATRPQIFMAGFQPTHAEPSVVEWLLHDDQVMRECFGHATGILKFVTGAAFTTVTLLDAAHQHFCGDLGTLVANTPRDSSLSEHALRNGGVFVVEDTRERADVQGCDLVQYPPHVRFFAGVPIRLPDGEPIGALCAMDPAPRRMDANARGVLRHLGEMIENDLRLRMASAVDPLTQLFNRRSTLESVHHRWQDTPDGEGVGSVMVDIDWFKQYNDTYGHPAGDGCLRAVAEVLREAAEEHNMIAGRVGGEEFALLLTGVERAELGFALERVRAGVERLGIEHRGSPLGVVTLSMGATHTWRNAPSDHGYRDAFCVADDALYEAKKDGRNCVRFA